MPPDAFLIFRTEQSTLAHKIGAQIEQAKLQVSVATALDDPHHPTEREIIESAYRYARCVVFVQPPDEAIPWIQSDDRRAQRMYIVTVDEASDQVRILSVPERHVLNNYYIFSGAIAELITLIEAEPERDPPAEPYPTPNPAPPPTPIREPERIPHPPKTPPMPAADIPTTELDPVYPPEPPDSGQLRGLRERIAAMANDLPNATNIRSDDGSPLAILVITKGTERDTIFITHTPFIVGRAVEAGSDYAITLQYMSRRHFAIYLEHGDFLIEDLNSSNGTQVDGRRLESGGRQVLQPGSVIGVMNRLTLIFQPNTDQTYQP